MHLDAIEVRFEMLLQRARRARALVDRGVVCDLAGFDTDISEVCMQAASLPASEGAALHDHMVELISCLEQVAEGLSRIRRPRQ